MRLAHLIAAPLFISAIACSSNSVKKAPDGKPVDGSMSIDTPPGACTAVASYGTITPAAGDQIGTKDAATPGQVNYDGKLNADPSYDDLSIQLFKGAGTYATGEIVAKSIPLTGAEIQYKDCGGCVLIYTDIHASGDGGSTDTDVYMATGGTLNITSVSPNLTGTITNAMFTHVTIAADFTSTAVGDCNSAIASFSFNTPLTVAAANFVGSNAHGRIRTQ